MEPSPTASKFVPTISPNDDPVLIEHWVRTCDQRAKPVAAVTIPTSGGTIVEIPDFGVELIFTTGEIRVQVIIGHVWGGSIPSDFIRPDKGVTVRMVPLCPTFDAIGIDIVGFCDRCVIVLWRNPSPGAIAVRIPREEPAEPVSGTMYDVVAYKLGFPPRASAASEAIAKATPGFRPVYGDTDTIIFGGPR
jgi:hypothetical protein